MPKNEENVAILKDNLGREVALKGVRAHARLHGLLAEVEVEQSYRNPQDTNIEAVYTFPLPFGAVLLSLEVEIAGKKLAGQVVEKKEAVRRYEDAVTDGDSTVMLEEAGPGLYTASLGNLMAGESAVIRYRYGLLLNWQGDRLRFLMPTTIAPRYGDALAAGLQPHQVPVSALDVDYPLVLTIDVEGDLAGASIASPSHPIAMERTDAGIRVRLDRKAFLDRDFVLTLASEKAQSSCVLVPDGAGQVGLASLRIPPLPSQDRQPLALKLVIDCSGSMGGTSIVQAGKAALAILDQLRPGDSFNVTLFGSHYKHFFRTMVPASARYITEAWNLIEQMDADLGGTEMETALDAVFALRTDDVAGTVLLITDGEIEEHEKLVRRAGKSGQRVFVVGVGHAVAETFLESLADRTGGACELVAPQEGMAEFVLTQFHRMRQQRVGALQIEWPGRPDWSMPLPETVFAGDTIHAFAGFHQPLTGNVRLVIDGAGEVVVPVVPAQEAEIPRIAAARRMAVAEEAEGLRLALDYQLLSRWTNFLVIAERADKAETLPELHQIPQMLAAGWGGTGMRTSTGLTLECCSDTFAPDELFTAGRARDSRVQAMSDTGMDKYDIPAFLRKQADDDIDSQPPVPAGRPAGDLFDVTRERIRQIEAKALRKLRMPSRSEKLRSFLDLDDTVQQSADLDAPAGFIAALEVKLAASLLQPKLPVQLSELEQCGLVKEILKSLYGLVMDGHDEAEVVAAFVYALTQSAAGECFGRSFKRAILKAWKQVVPGREIDRALHDALRETTREAWNWADEPVSLVRGTVAEAG